MSNCKIEYDTCMLSQEVIDEEEEVSDDSKEELDFNDLGVTSRDMAKRVYFD